MMTIFGQKLILNLTNIRKLQIYLADAHVSWKTTDLLEILQSLGNTENLTITYLDIWLENEFDQQVTEDIVRTGIKI